MPAELLERHHPDRAQGLRRRAGRRLRESGVTTLNVTPIAPTHAARVALIEQIRALAPDLPPRWTAARPR